MERAKLAILVALAALGLAACGAQPAADPAPEATEETETTETTETSEPTGEPTGAAPTETGTGTDEPDPSPGETQDEEDIDVRGETIIGTLGGDPMLEGGCAWIETDDGTIYEVLYPDGYEVTFDPLQLMGPQGEVMASAGDRVRLTGAPAPDMMSFCQIGPIYRAESVEPA